MASTYQLMEYETFECMYGHPTDNERSSSSMSNSGSSFDMGSGGMYMRSLGPFDYGPVILENQYFDQDEYQYYQ